MHAAIQKAHMTNDQNAAQLQLIKPTMLTDLEHKLGHIIHASNPQDMLQALRIIICELQLFYFQS